MSEPAGTSAGSEPLIIGRYALFDVLASGGMATVHLGRLLGPVGFGRTVAIKRLHSHFTSDQDFVTMFMDEARIVARIRHPNVVPMVDVIESAQGLFLVMEYVHGESFSRLLRTCRAASEPVPIRIVNSIMHGVLLGLHAAHETRGANGELLDVVHRDVSPQNVIVGSDGVARVLDFGVAKAAGRAQVTREGQIKGKLTYMAPEQIRGAVDRRADVFAAAVVLWEALAGRRFHDGAKDVEIVTRVIKGGFEPPSLHRSDISPELDAITMRALEVDPAKRYQSARDMALDLERKVGLASPSEVGEWVERLATDALRARANIVAAMERAATSLVPAESRPPPAPSDQGYPVASPPAHAHAYAQAIDGQRWAVPNVRSTDPGSMSQGTPAGTEIPIEQERPSSVPVVAILSFCAALMLVGLLLGGWSLWVGRAAARAPSPASSVSQASSAPVVPSATVTGSASASSRGGTEAAPSASAAPTAERAPSERKPDKPSPPVDTPSRAPVSSPATVRVPPPPKKSECDPPYTVDEAGHRKYKLECMGTD